MTAAAIALGSNLGDRRGNLDYAANRLRATLKAVRISSYYETQPVGMRGPQGLFLNAALVGETDFPARALLETLLAIEQERGRTRPHRGAARTLDLDLVLFGSEKIEEADLRVPHPRFRTRRFVLEPLAEIAPELIDPVTGLSVEALLARLETSG